MNSQHNLHAEKAATDTQIQVNVNGAVHTLPRMTLAQWVASTGVLPTALATAINGQFVPRAARGEYLLQDGDVLTTFQPIAGG
jgi:sulfur carrier protein